MKNIKLISYLKKMKFSAHIITIIILTCCGFGTAKAQDAAQSVKHFNIGILTGTDTIHGLQLSALTNIAGSVRGVQMSALSNISQQPFRGFQISGISNISMGTDGGTQMSALANVAAGPMRGVQIGGYNYGEDVTGVQVGLLNAAVSHSKGVQIGLVNYTRDTLARKIGLVNINPKTRVDAMFFGGNTSKVNAALRFRNRSTYNIVGVGSQYMGLGEQFSGALYYRLGQYLPLGERWTLSGDLGYAHIETFLEHHAVKPERLYSLQAHLNLDYQINRMLGIYGSVGYGNTHRYGGPKYKDEFIAQLGLTLRWQRQGDAGLPSYAKKYKGSHLTDSLHMRSASGKRYWQAAAEVTGINVFVQLFDRYPLNKDYAQTDFADIKDNFRRGFVWDNDGFSTNLSAHPYHGNLYFNAARSNGLSFWESAPYAMGGSLMWEFLGEKEPPAINDLMATTMGGIALGEVTHRVSHMILNDSQRGMNRFWREFAATVVNPIQGLHRIISGDAWRIRHTDYLYYDREALPYDLALSTGTRYLSDMGALMRGEWNPYISIFLEYGDPLSDKHQKPYDFFSIETTIGLSGNQPLFNRIHLLGRLWGRQFETNGSIAEVGLYQHFNYYNSEAVKDGSDVTPYRISEAASVGPGLIMRFPETGVLTRLEQRLFLSGILLGGSKSDYYHVVDRDYNMGSGFSVKTKTHMEMRNFGRFILRANLFRLYTWKGYEEKDLSTVNPTYLNVQGDKGNARLIEINPMWEFDFKNSMSATIGTSWFYRNTHYRYFDNVTSRTFEVKAGVAWHF